MRDEMEEFDFDTVKKYFKNEADRKIFQQVFDSKTLDAVHVLATKGLFDVLEHVVSTGKEAHVFVSADSSQNKRAVKIYMKETTKFRKMNEYIQGDERFKRVKKDRMNLVFAWAKKEYKNLMIAWRANLNVPLPLGFRENVLVMEFIGENQNAAPRLKDTKPTRGELVKVREKTANFIAGLYVAGLVHADLSEYNILIWKSEPYFIDFAQGLLLSHPSAREFFERDVKNMALYFTKAGLETSYDELYEMVKSNRDKIVKKTKTVN